MPPGSQQASFIPKSALTKQERPTPRPTNLLFVIAILIFAISATVFGGAYGYKTILTAEIERPCSPDGTGVERCGLKASVERERQNIDQNTITSLQRLDSKLEIAEKVLIDHQTVLPVFTLLENLTLPTIAYRGFTYSTKGLTMDGKATSYEDIAVQTQIFSANKKQIQSFIFSDLNLDNEGAVTFKLTVVLDPAVINYLKNQ